MNMVKKGHYQSGQAGEHAAELWFKRKGWHMVRTQPPVTILGMVSRPMVAALRRFIPRLSSFGHMVIARMGKGGAPDYTGYHQYILRTSDIWSDGDVHIAEYRSAEVKECNDDRMPASRLSKEQRAFMSALPEGCAYVGILWKDGTFEVYPFIDKGSYKREES